MGLRLFFQKRLKKVVRFKLFRKKQTNNRVQTVFEKIPHPGARVRVDRGQGPGPRPQPGGVFFQTQFGNGPFFQNSFKKHLLFSNLFEKHPQIHFQKRHPASFQSFTF